MIRRDRYGKWSYCAFGGEKRDIYELYRQYHKLRWVCPACKRLIPSAILRKTHLCQQQNSLKVDDTESFELGDTVRTGLLEAAECKDNQPRQGGRGYGAGINGRDY